MTTLLERYIEHTIAFDHFPDHQEIDNVIQFRDRPNQYKRPQDHICSEHSNSGYCEAFSQSMSRVLIRVNGDFYRRFSLATVESFTEQELYIMAGMEYIEAINVVWVKIDLDDVILSEVICPCGAPDTDY